MMPWSLWKAAAGALSLCARCFRVLQEHARAGCCWHETDSFPCHAICLGLFRCLTEPSRGTDSSLEYVILQNQYMPYLFICVCVYMCVYDCPTDGARCRLAGNVVISS